MFMQTNGYFCLGKNQSQPLISLKSTNFKDLTNFLLLPFWKTFQLSSKENL